MNTVLSFRFAATLLLLGGALWAVGLAERRVPEQLAVPLDQISSRISGWTEFKNEELDPGVLRALRPTTYLSRGYAKGPEHLDLFIAYYAQQRAGESMHSPKHCLPGSGWEIWQHGSATIPAGGREVTVNKYSIQNAGRRMLMFYWYQSRGRVVASEYMGKLLLARDTLLTGRTAASIVRVTLPDSPDASKKGSEFARELIPQVQRCFGE